VRRLADPADLVRDNCVQLRLLHPRLEYAITQASSGDGGSMVPRPADAPFPGNAEAFGALMVIIEKVPRLEASLLMAVAGHPGLRRGGSTGNFLDALGAIPGLAAGLKDADDEAAAGRILEWLVKLAQSVRAIDEAERWRPLPQRPCPRCDCFFLRVQEDARGQPGPSVRCFGHLPSGEPCRAAWASLAEIAQDLERAETMPDLDR
jgi:hypothetical protein